MPFEPLRTDEKVEGKVRGEKSMDDLMLSGCSGFVGCSFSTFLLGMWPFLVFGSSHESNLLLAFPVGLIPALILGAYVSRKFGLAASCGFVGGAMALGIFMHLIANQVITAIFIQGGKQSLPPLVLIYLIPAGWVLLALAVAYTMLPKSELRDHFSTKKP
jgi:hypothetical protein